jgi:O-antigen/teichoic acid export membrane protein
VSYLKDLRKDAIIYGIGGVLAKGLSFILLPFYTRLFTPAEYGIIEMLTVISSLLSAILMLGMDSAQSFYFFKHKEEGQIEQARIVSSILQLRLLWGGILVFVSTLLAPLLNATFFSGKLTWEYFAVAFIGTFFAQIMSQSAEVLRMLFRPWGYIGIIISQSLLSSALILSALIIFEQGIFGYFFGAAMASLSVALIGWFKIRVFLKFDSIHIDFWPQIVRFGAPLAPASLAIYFMNTADRWFVQNYHGEQALGVFAVGAKFAMLITFIVETFRQAWWPIALNSISKPEGKEIFRIVAVIYIAIGTIGMLFLNIIAPWLMKFLFTDQYKDAWKIVGVLGWHSVFYGLFMIISVGIWKNEKTYLNMPIMAVSLVIGIILNYMLVPKFGGMGAAIATSTSYGVWIAVTFVISQRLWKINFPLKFGLSCFIGGALFTLYFITHGFKTPLISIMLMIILTIMIVFRTVKLIKTLPK